MLMVSVSEWGQIGGYGIQKMRDEAGKMEVLESLI